MDDLLNIFDFFVSYVANVLHLLTSNIFTSVLVGTFILGLIIRFLKKHLFHIKKE